MDFQGSPVYEGPVRRALLSLLMTFALVAGGLASAGAAFACPMNQPPAAHDCCPDSQPARGGDSGKDVADCPYMQA